VFFVVDRTVLRGTGESYSDLNIRLAAGERG
jgi:hypothetical protein